MTQLALLRELLGAFTGNEMVLGITLGLWLLLMGSGTLAGRCSNRIPEGHFVLCLGLVWLAILPLAQVFLLRTLRDVVFVRGATVGLIETTVSAAVLLLPYCLPAGFLLALACSILARAEGVRGIGQVYAADSCGSIVGGLLFSFVLVGRFDHIALLLWPAVLNLAAAASLDSLGRRHTTLTRVVLGAATLLVAAAAFMNLDAISTARQFSGQEVKARINSPYGRLVVTESGGQFNFFENGLLLCTTEERQQVEETVHYALAQRPDARRVLLIGGGLSGAAKEVFKHDVTAVDYVELDPQILNLGRRFLPSHFSENRLRVHLTDGRRFIRQTRDSDGAYDVILINSPAPSTAQLNRFYTVEFFAEVKRALARNGVMLCSLGHYENAVSPELSRVLACARRSIETSFAHVLVLPGSRVFFLASDGPLTHEIAGRLEAAGINTTWVGRHYLDAMFSADRLADLSNATTQPAERNSDINPVLYYYHLRHWLSQFDTRLSFIPVILLVLPAIYVARLRPPALVLFASGFAASTLELVLLLLFQVLCGSMYEQLGIIVTIFMGGLAVGAWLANHLVDRPVCCGPRLDSHSTGTCAHLSTCPRLALSWLSFGLVAFAATLPLAFQALRGLAPASLVAVKLTVALLTFLLALLVAMQFPLASQLDHDTVTAAARLYTADLIGASLGALLTGAVLLPLLGINWVCLFTAGLCLAAGAAARWSTRTLDG